MITANIVNRSYEINFTHDAESFIKVKRIAELMHQMNKHCIDTAWHCFDVAIYAVRLGKSLDLSEEELKKLWYAAILHDAGKLQVPISVLNKREKLTEEEFELIKRHSIIGYDLVKDIKGFRDIAQCILQHHERYDGKGYPNRSSGNDINLLSRIISVADAYDAMISKRPYKEPKTKEEALEEIISQRWRQFDGNVVNSFVNVMNSTHFYF